MLLIVVIIAVFLALRLKGWDSAEAACYGLAAGLFLSGWDHLLRRDWYVSLMAPWLPNRALLVTISAVLRMALAAMLLRPGAVRLGAAIATLVLMLIVLQVNLRVALVGDQIEAARSIPAAWRWLRLALHLVWLGWTVYCVRAAWRQKRPPSPASVD